MADRTESSIRIAAPRAAVMAVIAAIPDYPSWNAEVKEVEVLAVHPDGRPARARFVLDAGVLRDTYVLAYAWQDDRSCSWTLVEGGMLTAMDGDYALADDGAGATRVTYRLAVDVKVPVIGVIRRKAEKVVVDRALAGLAARVGAGA